MRNAAALLIATLALSFLAGATAGPALAAQLPTTTVLSTQTLSVGIFDSVHLLAIVRDTPEDGGGVSLYRNGAHVMDRDLSPNGAANFTLPDGLPAGTHTFVAVFNGTAGSETSTSDPVVIEVVDDRTPTTTVLELIPSTIEKDESVLFRVTITPAPESAVDVPVGKAGHGWDVAIDPATGIGERILTPEEHQAEMTGHGAFPLVAYYPGTTLTAPSESTKQWLTIVKHPTTTTVSVEPAAVTAGSSATIDVAVAPAPTTLLHAGVTVAHPTLADWSTSVPLGAEGDGSVVFDSTGWPDGTFEVTATWAGTNDDASSTDTSAITIDSTGPVGSIVVGGGAAYTKSTAVTLAVAAVDALSDIEAIQLSNDGTNWTTRPYAASQPWTLPAVDGTRTVRVRWQDELGNWSPIATDSIMLDRVAPTTSAPSRRLPAGTVLTSGRIQLRRPGPAPMPPAASTTTSWLFGPTAAAGRRSPAPCGPDVRSAARHRARLPGPRPGRRQGGQHRPVGRGHRVPGLARQRVQPADRLPGHVDHGRGPGPVRRRRQTGHGVGGTGHPRVHGTLGRLDRQHRPGPRQGERLRRWRARGDRRPVRREPGDATRRLDGELGHQCGPHVEVRVVGTVGRPAVDVDAFVTTD